MNSVLSTPHQSQNVSSPAGVKSTPRQFSPFQNRRGDMTFAIDEEDYEDLNSSIIKFPPEATQIFDEENDFSDDHQDLDIVEPLPCHLGEPDFALHSSVFMTLQDPPFPPSYSQVEEELKQRKAGKLQPVITSQPEPEEGKKEIDLSASMSMLWTSQKSLENAMNSSLLSPNMSGSISRRAFLPIQENHCTVASLELLVRTRRQTGNLMNVPRSSHAISIASLGGFFAPDPQLDSINAAALAFDGKTFLLIATEVKICTVLNTTALSPIVIFCKDEVDLLNWIVYLIQK